MSLLGQYIAVVLLHRAERAPTEQLGGSASGIAKRILQTTSLTIDPSDIAEAIAILEPFGAADKDFNPLAGGYWEIDYDNFRYYFIENSPDSTDNQEEYAEIRKLTDRYPILQAFARRGIGYAEDVISNLQSIDNERWERLREETSGEELLAPGSDRVVTLKHNQIVDLDNQATAVIGALEALNHVENSPGLREVLLGQLKAGRELIREGCFRLFVIEITLIEGLKFLAKRYEREVVGALASALLAALAAYVGTSV